MWDTIVGIASDACTNEPSGEDLCIRRMRGWDKEVELNYKGLDLIGSSDLMRLAVSDGIWTTLWFWILDRPLVVRPWFHPCVWALRAVCCLCVQFDSVTSTDLVGLCMGRHQVTESLVESCSTVRDWNDYWRLKERTSLEGNEFPGCTSQWITTQFSSRSIVGGHEAIGIRMHNVKVRFDLGSPQEPLDLPDLSQKGVAPQNDHHTLVTRITLITACHFIILSSR